MVENCYLNRPLFLGIIPLYEIATKYETLKDEESISMKMTND